MQSIASRSDAPSDDHRLTQNVDQESGYPRQDPAAYRRCLGDFGTGITVITARVGDKLVGMTANSFTSVSLDPPLILWSAKRTSASFPVFEAASHFAVNILAREQVALSKHFGKSGEDKFSSVSWSPGLGGAPILDEALASFECSTFTTYPGGDHLIILGEVGRYTRSVREALLFVQGRYCTAAEYAELPSSTAGETHLHLVEPMREFMTAQLYRAHGALSGALDVGRRTEGLTVLQSRVMAAVQTLPRRTVDDLLPELFMGRNATEETVAELIQVGIIERDDHGRLSMTSEGIHRNSRLLERARSIEVEKLSGLPAGDVAACRRVLQALVAIR